jgi:hypothetical protein
MSEPIILAFLQNLWVKNPEIVYNKLKRNPGSWNRWCKKLLFSGGTTGRRIKEVFGDLADNIIWDEVTKEIADNPKIICKPDNEHIINTIERVKPQIIIVFGNVAQKAVSDLSEGNIELRKRLRKNRIFLAAPHPARRDKNILNNLRSFAEELRNKWIPHTRVYETE